MPITARVPERTRRWAATALGAQSVSLAPLPGGRTGSVSLVRTPGGTPFVLRALSPVAWGPEARRHVTAEQLATGLLAGQNLPVPAPVAADPDGTTAGIPASLTTFLPGRVRLDDALSAAELRALAEIAVAVHATPVAPPRRPAPFRPWAPPRVKVPDFAHRPDLWRAAIQRYEIGPPPAPSGLLHRDFHPGNVLWCPSPAGWRLTGLVDWAEASWGAPDLDVAHCCTNLAVLDGLEQARRFRAAYQDAGGQLADGSGAAYWQLVDLFGYLPDPGPHLEGLLRHRPEVSTRLLTERLEDLLTWALESESFGEGLSPP